MRLAIGSGTLMFSLALLAAMTVSLEGGRFGGAAGGGHASGGAARAGGGGGAAHAGGGGAARAAHSAPISRPAPAARPTQVSRPAASSAARTGGVHGPYGGLNAESAISRPANTGPRPATGVIGNNAASHSGSWTGPGGSTISGGSGFDKYTGPRGGVVVAGGKGGEFTGPGGNTAAAGKGGAVVIGPNGNVHASGAKAAAIKTPGGAFAGGAHGSATFGPNGAAASGSRGAIATGPGGTVAARERGAIAVGPHGAVATGSRGVAGRGAYGAGYAGTRFVAANTLAHQGAYVRQNFGHYHAFYPGWYTHHPGAWFAAGWAANAVWRAATWDSCVGYVGYPESTAPVYYDYGDNVTYQDGTVYYGDQPYGTEADYAQQASDIAAVGLTAPPADEAKWNPLGVFAMVAGDETTSNDIFQLAINADGMVRGNYHNASTDATTPIYGSLDKKTQRIAWVIGDNKNTVFETGLFNLTQDQTTLLVHHGTDETEQLRLFRIEQPVDAAQSAPN